jgi:hypothetical protein
MPIKPREGGATLMCANDMQPGGHDDTNRIDGTTMRKAEGRYILLTVSEEYTRPVLDLSAGIRKNGTIVNVYICADCNYIEFYGASKVSEVT